MRTSYLIRRDTVGTSKQKQGKDGVGRKECLCAPPQANRGLPSARRGGGQRGRAEKDDDDDDDGRRRDEDEKSGFGYFFTEMIDNYLKIYVLP